MVVLLKRSVHSRKCGRVFVLILICSLIRLLNCQDNVKESNPQAEVETVQNPPASNTTDIESLTEARCNVKRKGCCEELHLDHKKEYTKCVTLHQDKIPAEDDTDILELFQLFSCLIECIYKSKNYIGTEDTINMKMVKADVAKTFADRPKEKEYHIKMYEFCRKDALNMYNLVRMTPAGLVLFKDTCRPYFMFVFLCQTEYHKKKTCPYFRWQGASRTEAEVTCLDAKIKCYEIDGISVLAADLRDTRGNTATLCG